MPRRGLAVRLVADLLGRVRPSARAYGSGVNLHYSLDELLAQVGRWIEAGFDAVKIKVGKPDLAEDVDRVAAVRELLGPDRDLMIDANQRWDLDRATRSVDALAAFAPAWIEEPLRADDLSGHTELARRIDVPIAVGENLHTAFRFDEYPACRRRADRPAQHRPGRRHHAVPPDRGARRRARCAAASAPSSRTLRPARADPRRVATLWSKTWRMPGSAPSAP